MEYYIVDERNQPKGPFSVDQLKSKNIRRTSKVWCQGMQEWADAETVEELKSLFIAPPPPNFPPLAPQTTSNINDFNNNSHSQTSTSSPVYKEHVNAKELNYVALVAAGIAAISVFLPWVEASSSARFGGFNSSWSSGGISGILLGGGIFGLLLALAGGFMAFKNIKWAFIFGVINFIDGLGYILGWFGAGVGGSFSSSYGGGRVKASFDPQFGLYLFVLASLVFVISTLKKKATKGEYGT
jgi:hypothetical protein